MARREWKKGTLAAIWRKPKSTTKGRLIQIGVGILVFAFLGWLMWYSAPQLFR